MSDDNEHEHVTLALHLPALHEAMWECDTPSGCTMLLESNEHTELRTTTLFFALAPLPDGTFSASFCGREERHVHITIGQQTPIAWCSVIAAMTYAMALAIDRAEWRSPPEPDELVSAWERVLEVIAEEHDDFARFLRHASREGGPIGPAGTWARHFESKGATNTRASSRDVN